MHWHGTKRDGGEVERQILKGGAAIEQDIVFGLDTNLVPKEGRRPANRLGQMRVSVVLTRVDIDLFGERSKHWSNNSNDNHAHIYNGSTVVVLLTFQLVEQLSMECARGDVDRGDEGHQTDWHFLRPLVLCPS